jgi:predicted nucleotide-binding protein
MASYPPKPEAPKLTIKQTRRRIERLRDCIRDLEALDLQKVQRRFVNPEVTALEAAIKGALAAAFGDGTSAFDRYKRAASIDDGTMIARSGQTGGGRDEIDHEAREAQEARRYIANGKDRSIGLLRTAIQALEHNIADLEQSEQRFGTSAAASAKGAPSRKVFVVHGHDDGAREAVARFLEQIGFEAIILHEQASQGRTVIEKVEAHGEVGFAVVLLTPDYEGCKKGETLKSRARQNVVLELGYFVGRLGRDRVCAMTRGDVEIPSDFGGVVYEPFDVAGGWRQALGRELQAAGFDVDWNNVMRS